jgi:hypothetical protein
VSGRATVASPNRVEGVKTTAPSRNPTSARSCYPHPANDHRRLAPPRCPCEGARYYIFQSDDEDVSPVGHHFFILPCDFLSQATPISTCSIDVPKNLAQHQGIRRGPSDDLQDFLKEKNCERERQRKLTEGRSTKDLDRNKARDPILTFAHT